MTVGKKLAFMLSGGDTDISNITIRARTFRFRKICLLRTN